MLQTRKIFIMIKPILSYNIFLRIPIKEFGSLNDFDSVYKLFVVMENIFFSVALT